jgi:hypothetical protein
VVEDLDENSSTELGLTRGAAKSIMVKDLNTPDAGTAKSGGSVAEDLHEGTSCELGLISKEVELVHTTAPAKIGDRATDQANSGDKSAVGSARRPGCMVESLDLNPGESFVLAMQDRELSLEDSDRINQRKVAARLRSVKLTGKTAVASGRGNMVTNAHSIASLLRTIEDLRLAVEALSQQQK